MQCVVDGDGLSCASADFGWYSRSEFTRIRHFWKLGTCCASNTVVHATEQLRRHVFCIHQSHHAYNVAWCNLPRPPPWPRYQNSQVMQNYVSTVNVVYVPTKLSGHLRCIYRCNDKEWYTMYGIINYHRWWRQHLNQDETVTQPPAPSQTFTQGVHNKPVHSSRVSTQWYTHCGVYESMYTYVSKLE